jgi:hypothetical protein
MCKLGGSAGAFMMAFLACLLTPSFEKAAYDGASQAGERRGEEIDLQNA